MFAKFAVAISSLGGLGALLWGLEIRHFHVTTTGISRVFRHDADVKERALRACRTVGSSPQSYLRGLLRAMAHTRCCRRFRWVRKLRFERDISFGVS